MSGRLIAAVVALLGAGGCIDSLCDCQPGEIVVTVYDEARNQAVAGVQISSSPTLSFTCTEQADRTECIADGAPYGTVDLTVTAPGYRSVNLSGEVREPDPNVVCDCGGLSLTVPLTAQ